MSDPCVVAVLNRLSELERVSRVVDAFGEDHGLSPKVVFQLNLALDEVLTNVMSYAYPDAGEHEIIVRLSVGLADVVIEVEDDGQPFNPLEVPAPELDTPLAERSVGGLGIHLVRKVMDRLEYRRQQGKNVLVMRRSIAGRQ